MMLFGRRMLGEEQWLCPVCREDIDEHRDVAVWNICGIVQYRIHLKCLEDATKKYREQTRKDPIVLMPRDVWEDGIMEDTAEAIIIYLAAKRPIPIDWVEKYNELVQRG